MAQIHVYTDDGTKCLLKLTDVTPQNVAFLQCPFNHDGSAMAAGIRRAVQDAHVLAQGGDPERLSERAMRLSEWNDKRVRILNATPGYASFIGKIGTVRHAYVARNNIEKVTVDFDDGSMSFDTLLSNVARVLDKGV